MSFKSLIEFGDLKIKEEIEDYYFISKSRMDELIRNFEEQANQIKNLNIIISEQQERIKSLQDMIIQDSEI